MRVAFLINDLQLSGGVGVVLQHSRELGMRHGIDVTLVLAREQELESWTYETLEDVRVVSLSEAQSEQFDVAVCTWWETAFALFSLRASRYAYFVQSLEDRFYHPLTSERLVAPLSYDLPVAFITEARWIADTLAELRPDAPCYLVRNGIDKSVFAEPDQLRPNLNDPLRILVEGHPSVWFKHVGHAVCTTALMSEPRSVTLVTGERDVPKELPADKVLGSVTHREMARLYADHDVVLKLSSVEGMFGPPLEGFHLGATCVVTPVTGHEEYVKHGYNGLVCDWDDPRGTARLLDLLARDRILLHYLRQNALLTARGWPSWQQQGAFMAATLRAIAETPPPAAVPAMAALMTDVQALLHRQRLVVAERDALRNRLTRLERVLRLPGVAQLHRTWQRPGVRRLASPVARRLMRRRA